MLFFTQLSCHLMRKLLKNLEWYLLNTYSEILHIGPELLNSGTISWIMSNIGMTFFTYILVFQALPISKHPEKYNFHCHSTTTWTNFDPHPPRVDKGQYFAYPLLFFWCGDNRGCFRRRGRSLSIYITCFFGPWAFLLLVQF